MAPQIQTRQDQVQRSVERSDGDKTTVHKELLRADQQKSEDSEEESLDPAEQFKNARAQTLEREVVDLQTKAEGPVSDEHGL